VEEGAVKVILFGATGMIGQGALRECLLDPGVDSVLAVGRSATAQQSPKLREIVVRDMSDLSPVADQLSGYDACFFCLGISSAGLSEAEYRHVTYDIAVGTARTLLARNPGLTFIFVSGTGADSSERGRIMWARIKGATENAILAMPFKAAYVFRPAFIQPRHGITSRTRMYRVLYALLGPLFPLIKMMFPGQVSTTEEIGRAMIAVARRGAPKRVLENSDNNLSVT
jgi:uncharacterized protein YbjT (DUF2867 family)